MTKTKGFTNTARCIATCIVLATCIWTSAQPIKKFSAQTFTVNEGLLANRVLDIIEDNNRFIWISTAAGLQRFNGSKLDIISSQAGLIKSDHHRFFKLSDGSLWLSYFHGVSSYNSLTNKFRLVHTNSEEVLKESSDQSEASPLMPVLESGSKVWCWLTLEQKFIAIDKMSFRITDSFKLTGINVFPHKFRKAKTNSLMFACDEGVAEVDLLKKRVIRVYDITASHGSLYSFYPFKKSILSATKKGLYRTDIVSGVTTFLSNYPKEINTQNATLDYLYDNLFSISINNELYVINAATGEFLYRMVNHATEPFVTPGYINFSMLDSYDNLWVASRVEGLKKISFNKLDIKYYGVTDMRKNFSRSIYPDKKANLVITGSLFNSISLFDTLGSFIKQYNLPPFVATAEVSCILKAGPDKYLIFLDSKYSVHLLDMRRGTLSPILQKKSRRYYPIKTFGDTAALLWYPRGIERISFIDNKIQFQPILQTKRSLCGLLDTEGKLWLGAAGKFTILKGKNFGEEKVFYLEQNVVTKCFGQDNAGYVWLGTEQGLYKLDPNTGAVLHIYKKQDGLADETIYSVVADKNNNIWCSTNKGISCIYTNGKISNIYSSDGLQHNEFNTNSFARASDGELFFGGINGVNSFFPEKLKSAEERPNVLITHIKVLDKEWNSDTAAWNMQQIELPYTENILSFNFTAIGRYNPDVYKYHYKMVGVDKGWVSAGNNGYARYALPPGKYTFEYSANLTSENDHTNKKYISITITPPFWKTAWFRFFLLLIIAATTGGIIYLFNKQRDQKITRKFELQKSLQRERERISRDLHDNIGAYTTVLLANTEQLSRQIKYADMQESAQNISDNAKSIIGSLQETIWVLNNDSITVTDFADRLKLYAKKVIKNLAPLQLHFKEDIQIDGALSPNEALNIFRIMQEALQNAIKHSGATRLNIQIISAQTISIVFNDDGEGFNANNVIEGHGINNMHHRAKESGYQLIVTSGNVGTQIELVKNRSDAV